MSCLLFPEMIWVNILELVAIFEFWEDTGAIKKGQQVENWGEGQEGRNQLSDKCN